MASVLLIEDNDDHAILAEAALSRSDQKFEVERAASANECLAMLGRKHYDAIVLDYSLPKKSGLELLQDIQKISYDAPVVMITSHGDEQIAVEAMKRGAYDYVSKSDDYLAKLPLVLEKAIEIHEMAKEKAELQAKIEKSENTLRSIFENVEVGIIEIQDDYSVSYANPRAKHYFGMAGALQTVDIRAMFSDTPGMLENSFKTGEPASCEVNYDSRQFSIAVTAIQGADDHVKQLVAVLMDVTEQRKLQQQLTQSERIGALGQMASGVAHDFNNILAAILGRTEIMLMDPSDAAEVEKGLQIVQKAALEGADTVRRIQEFTRVAKQKEYTKLEVNDIVCDAVKMTEPRWKDQSQRDGIKIDVSVDTNSHSSIAGSASDLKEALTNMIFNSLDAMPDGGVLSLKTYDEDNNVCISISDTGIGIEPGIIGSIFEPFFTTKDIGHPGLGLSVAYGIINRHEGGIKVNSIPGEGAAFIIRLPAYIERKQEENAVAAPSETGQANILIIDDEEMIRELLANILVRFNHNVAKAADGITGMEMFRSGSYDIIFTDLGMPEISGWEVAQQIKAIDPDATVILITGWGVELDKSELKQRKIDSVVPKPFQINQILEVVSKALE